MIAMIDIPVDSVILETQMVELTESGQKALGIDFANANGQIGVVTFIRAGSSSRRRRGATGGGNLLGHVTSVQFQAALYAADPQGQRPHRLEAADRRAERLDRQDHHRRRAADPDGDHLVGRQRRFAAGPICERRRDVADRAAGQRRRLRHRAMFLRWCRASPASARAIRRSASARRETSATVRDGDSFVIGGLTQDENITNKTKVPLLGDIPILGQAFRTDRNTKSKTELYIVVTPHIVHRVGTAGSSRQCAALCADDDDDQIAMGSPAITNSGNGSPAARGRCEGSPAAGRRRSGSSVPNDGAHADYTCRSR